MILLTPGPCMTSDAVRAASAQPDLNHRDPEYAGVHAEVRATLSSLFGGFVPHLIGGSGTAAMEATVTSCIGAGPCLIVSNGYYAERYERIFAAHGMACEVLRFPWTSSWDLGATERALAARNYEAVLATHHETSTGRLNPVGELASIAARHGATVIVDAVSSLGAEPLDLSGVHAVFGSANKCLHGLPGVSFALLEPGFARRMAKNPPRTYYLHLPMYEGDRPPLTPPVPAMRAFRQALGEFVESGGVEARHDRYARQAGRIRAALRAISCQTFLKDEVASCAVTVSTVPKGLSVSEWLLRNYEAGFVLFECKGELAETHFQVSTMGEVTDEMVASWLRFIRRI